MTTPSEPKNPHKLLHSLPGMPEHGEAERLNGRGGMPNRPLKNRPLKNRPLENPPTSQEPRVLILWRKTARAILGRKAR